MGLTIYLSLLFLALFLLGLMVRRFFFVRRKSQMESRGPWVGRTIARAEEMSPGSVKKFWLIWICLKKDHDLIRRNTRLFKPTEELPVSYSSPELLHPCQELFTFLADR